MTDFTNKSISSTDRRIKQLNIDHKLVDKCPPKLLAEGALGRLLCKFDKYRAIEDDLGAWMDSPVTVNADYGPQDGLAYKAFEAAIAAKQAMAAFTNAIARYGHDVTDKILAAKEA